MARTTAKKASPKRHKAKRAETPPKKRTGSKPARANATGTQRARGGKATKAARPRRLPATRKKQILRQVSRRRKQPSGQEPMPVEEHMGQDPRLLEIQSGNPGDTRGPNMNYGEYKNKAVARMDPPGNWFRKAPKAPEK